jgi:hypothetical protein
LGCFSLPFQGGFGGCVVEGAGRPPFFVLLLFWVVVVPGLQKAAHPLYDFLHWPCF